LQKVKELKKNACLKLGGQALAKAEADAGTFFDQHGQKGPTQK
jgi:hypothetical protein